MPELTDRINPLLFCRLVMQSSRPTSIRPSNSVTSWSSMFVLELVSVSTSSGEDLKNILLSNSGWLITIYLFMANEAKEIYHCILLRWNGVKFWLVRVCLIDLDQAMIREWANIPFSYKEMAPSKIVKQRTKAENWRPWPATSVFNLHNENVATTTLTDFFREDILKHIE